MADYLFRGGRRRCCTSGAVCTVQIVKAINSKLKTNPEIFGKPLRKPQHGKWSLRVGDYRVIYELENETHLVKITAIGHRRDIYEQ